MGAETLKKTLSNNPVNSVFGFYLPRLPCFDSHMRKSLGSREGK